MHTFTRPLAIPLTLTLCALGGSTAAQAYPLPFPARAASLDDDEVFTSGGHSQYAGKGGTTWALDISVRRFDGSAWTQWVDGATAPYSLAEDVAYGTPLYAAADGVVVACWRDLPDAPTPQTNNCANGCPAGHTAGGNHLSIVVPGESHLVFYAHFAEGTIPEELCPIVDADGLIDDMSVQACTNGLSGFRNSTRLDAFLAPHELPVVKKGDYLGDLGHSGNSSSPHLHIQVNPFEYDALGNPCQGVSEEIEFVETWHQPRVDGTDAHADAWQPLDQQPLPIDETTGIFAIWPDPLGARKVDLSLGSGNSIDVETDVLGGMAAYRNGVGALTLTSFRIGPGVDNLGDIIDGHTRSEGPVLALDLVKLPVEARDYVLAIRGSNGRLKVIPYRLDYVTGTITRQPGDLEDGPISLLAATRSPSHNGAVVAVRDGNGVLRVIDYVATFSTLELSRPGSAAVGNQQISDVAITAIDGTFQGVVTAEVASASNGVTLRSFEVTPGGSVIARDVEVAAGAIQDVELASIDGLLFPGMAAVALTMRTSGGNLRTQTWAVTGSGALTKLDDVSAGAVGVIDVAAVGGRDIVTGARDSDGDLTLISWSTDWAGDELRRAGTRLAGAITEIDLASFHNTPGATSHARHDHLIGGVRTQTGELKLISFAANYAPWH